MSEKIKMIEGYIESLQKNESNHYFIVPDAEGRSLASVQYIYNLALNTKATGKNVFMLFLDEKADDPINWMGEKYKDLTRITFKDLTGKLNLRASDFVYVPEIYTELMQNLHKEKVPSSIVVIAQNYDYCFNNMVLGESWANYNIKEVIVNSESMASYVSRYIGKYNLTLIYPEIEAVAVQKTRNPHIGVFGRNVKVVENTLKMFYQAYPQYKWISFVPLNSPTKEEFLSIMSKCAFVMWYDTSASFGTFPLEAMSCGVPVIGVRPDVIPDWMIEVEGESMRLANNGIWIDSIKDMPHLLAQMIERYLIDVDFTTVEDGFKTAQKFVSVNYSELQGILDRRIDWLNQVKEYELKQNETNEQ